MSHPAQPSLPRQLAPASALAVAAATGLACGALFAIREIVRAHQAYTWTHAEYTKGLASLLSLAATALVWDAAAGCGLAVLAGLAAWIVARVNGYRLDTARIAALCTVAFAVVVLPVSLKQAIAGEKGWLPFACALGFGCVAWGAGRWAGTPARLASSAAGLAAALVVGTCWSLWLRDAKPLGSSHLGAAAGQAIVLALAVAVGLGLRLLCFALLHRAAPRRRPTLGAALILLSVAALAAGSLAVERPRPRLTPATPPDTRPNVIWLLMDTARADALSCYGNPRKTSPFLDQMASEGALFERAYVQAGWTLPSHASMFTGLLPSRNGTTAEQEVLPDECTTIAEVLAKNGYCTFACSTNLNVSELHNMTQGFQRFHTVPWGRSPEYPLLIEQIRKGLRLTDDGSKAVHRIVTPWIDEACEARRPFFLFINYTEVHRPYGSTPYLGRWLPKGVGIQRALKMSQSPGALMLGHVPESQRDFRLLRALYDGDVTYLDERISELVGHLRGLGILDNTLLIVTSDHGEELGEHGEIGHDFGLRNTLLHVPLILRYPKAFAAGTRRADIVENLDLFPTILDVAGVDWDGRPGLQGRSLLAPPRPEAEQLAVAQRDLYLDALNALVKARTSWNPAPCTRRLMSIQDRRFKYVWASDDTAELFDLAQDPIENQDVLDRFPQEAKRLRAALEARVGHLRPGLSAAALARAAREQARNAGAKPN